MGSIILDVDGLKIFNDTLGHKVGDRLIIHFSKIILSVNEKGKDMIPIRLGGDEFLILVKEASKEKLINIIKTIKEKADTIEGFDKISFSSGYALRESSTSHMSVMLKEADDMLYEEKDRKTAYREELVNILKKKKI